MMDTKWQIRFMRIAKEVASWSKDPSSKIGAVIVDDNRRILATGYNGFPRGVKDDERLLEKSTKYPLVVHAELNALMNSLWNGVSVKDATLFVYGLPICSDCAKSVVQSGINTIVIAKPDDGINPRWAESWNGISLPLFEECGIRVVEMSEKDIV
jgi:dCMP deaminase